MSFLRNKVCVITGASSGIGEALAIEFAKQGANLALLARREDRLKTVAKACEALGVQTLTARCDVTQPQECEAAIQKTEDTFGKLDIVVANAGFGVVGSLEALKVEDYRRQLETNVFGVLNTIYPALKALEKSQGRLALMGSIMGFVSIPGASPYGMSKFAIRALADSLWVELKSKGISVTHIAPGFVQSEIRQVNNVGEYKGHSKDPVPMWIQMPAEKAAQQMVRAISKRKREQIVTAHGKGIVFFRQHFGGLLLRIALWTGASGRKEPSAQH